MTVAEVLILEARSRGLRHFFGVPGGGSSLEILEAARVHGVEFVTVAHESSAAIMAGYYGLRKQTAGLAMAIRGVGAANLLGGIASLWFERVPAVAVCDTAPQTWGLTCLQSADHRQMFRPVTKWSMTLCTDSAATAIRHAFASAPESPPGPILLDLPADVTAAGDAPLTRFEEVSLALESSPVEDAVGFLKRCARPLVLVGADVARSGACGQLARLVENIGAAVLVTMEARGTFPESNPRWAGVYLGLFNPNVVESRILDLADGVVTVGVDSIMTHTPWRSALPVCDISARPGPSLAKNPVVRVIGELSLLLRQIADQVRQPGIAPEAVQRVRQGILKYFRRPAGARFAVQDVLHTMRRLLPDDGILISETGAFVCMLEHIWPVNRYGTYLGTSGGRTMGLMIPAAIGSRLADPETPMAGLGGDGSLLMRLGELEVLARTKAALPLVIVNDGGLGTIKSRQKSRGYADYALDFAPADFAGIAANCGLRGIKATTPEEFESAMNAALAANEATLIDARVDPSPYHKSFGPTIGVLDDWEEEPAGAGVEAVAE